MALAAVFLLVRTADDVGRKKLFFDESLTDLISARPLPRLLDSVIVDRGGAPLHFVLSHIAILLDPSPVAPRWVSIVFAVAVVPASYSLGRRLGGVSAGATAAAVVATSSMLGVYASMGRMYSLLAFAAALAADMFVRAVRRPSGRTAAAAAAAAWLLPASHPYGGLVAAAEALVGGVLWFRRGRPLRPAVPVALIAVATLPFLYADLRLGRRYAVGVEAGGTALATPSQAVTLLRRALEGFVGGHGLFFLFFLLLGAAGLLLASRLEPAFAALFLLSLVAVPALALLFKGGGEEVRIAPRHLIFLLPMFAALVGLAVSRAMAGRSPPLRILAVLGVAALAVAAPPRTSDPRIYSPAENRLAALDPPARLLDREAGPTDAVYPASPDVAAVATALRALRHAQRLPHGAVRVVRDALDDLDWPVRSVYAAVPVPAGQVDGREMRKYLRETDRVAEFRSWLVMRVSGPFDDSPALLARLDQAYAAVALAMGSSTTEAARTVNAEARNLCRALLSFGRECPSPPVARS
jgi:hypothetical protein